MSEVANIPQLRFPGFSDEWEERPLKDVSTFFNGKAYKQAELLSSGKYPVLRVGNFFTNNSWYYSNLELDENKYCDNGDLLYAWSASFGPRIWAGEKVIYHCHIWKVINHSQVTKKFLFIVLDNETAKMKAQSANGFALLHITKGTIENWKINLPTRQEQQKIAAFLAAVDSKIEQLSKKQALLGEYKKGLMQQIFSQAIRFKADDGSDFPDWEEKKLGDVAEIVGGGTPPTAVEKYWNGNIQWFTPTEIKSKFIVNSKRTITQVGLDTSSAKLLPKGTLLFSSRATVGEVGIAVQECTTNQGFQSFIVNKNNEPEFLYNWIIKNKKEFIRRASGSTFLEIGKSEIKKIKLHIPALPEQTKIANFLSSIDSKIEQVGKQLDESKQFKKALLQQMFI